MRLAKLRTQVNRPLHLIESGQLLSLVQVPTRIAHHQLHGQTESDWSEGRSALLGLVIPFYSYDHFSSGVFFYKIPDSLHSLT